MALSVVQNVGAFDDNGENGSVTVTPASITAGNTLLAIIGNGAVSNSNISSFHDSNAVPNSWTKIVDYSGSGNVDGLQVWIAYNASGGTTPIDYSDGNQPSSMQVFELAGVHNGLAVDLDFGQQSYGGTASSGVGPSTATANEILFGIVSSGGGPVGTITADSGYTAGATQSSYGTCTFVEYKIVSAIQSAPSIAPSGFFSNYYNYALMLSLADSPVQTLAMSQLEDSFHESAINASLWNESGYGSYVGDGSLTVLTMSGSEGQYGGVNSTNTYYLTGSYAYVRINQAGDDTSVPSLDRGLKLELDSDNCLAWVLYGGQILAKKQIGGTWSEIGAAIAYNSSTMQYFRIREQSGTIYWDYSADGSTWTNYTSVATPFSVSKLTANLNAGTDAAESNVTAVQFDNFNVVDNPVSITKSVKYDVDAAISITESLKYTATTKRQHQIGMEYDILLGETTLAKSVKYYIRATEGKTPALKYTVKAAQSVQLDIGYSLGLTVTKLLEYVLTYAKQGSSISTSVGVAPVTFKHRTLFFKIQQLDSSENLLAEKNVEMTTGSVSVGSGGARRKCNFDLIEPLPDAWQSQRWKLYYGYQEVTGGDITYVSLGVFIPINPQSQEVYDGSLTSYQGSDKSKLFSDYQLTAPYTFALGTSIFTMFQTIAGWVGETKLKLASDLGTTETAYSFTEGTTADTILDTIADAHGDEWFYDVDGYLVAQQQALPSVIPVKYILDDPDVPLYITSMFNIDDSNYYNSVTVVGGMADTPIYRSSMQDSDAIAAAGNRIVQKYFTIDAAVTQAMVDGRAQYYLSQGVQLPHKLQLTNLALPDLDVGDIIQKGGVKYQVVSFDVPLDTSSQTIQAGAITG